jgi:hypothetical protein
MPSVPGPDSEETEGLLFYEESEVGRGFQAIIMRQLKKCGNPVVLTVNGKAVVVVQNAAAYQRLLALAERAETREFLREAKADTDAGRTVPPQEFLQSLGPKKKAKKA